MLQIFLDNDFYLQNRQLVAINNHFGSVKSLELKILKNNSFPANDPKCELNNVPDKAAKNSRSLAGPAFIIFLLHGLINGVTAENLSTSTVMTVDDAQEITAVVPRSWPPQYSVDNRGNPTGFAIDIMDAIAERAGLNIKYRVAKNFPEALRIFDQGGAAIIPNTGISPERQKNSIFSAPVETFFLSIFVRKDTRGIDGLDDLRDQNVGVVKRNIGEKFLQKHPEIRSTVHQDVRTALFDLLSGRIDALIFPNSVLISLAEKIGVENHIKNVGPPLLEIKRSIRIHKNFPELAKRINEVTKAFIGTKKYQEIYLRWHKKEKPFWTVTKVSGVMSGLLIALFITMAWWRYRSLVALNTSLRNSEERFRAFFDNTPVGLNIKDKEGHYLLVNKAVEKWVGRPEEDIIGKKASNYLESSPAFGKIIAADHALLETGEVQESEINIQKPDGTFCDQILIKFPIKSADGTISAIGTAAIDITERRKAERLLLESEEKLHKVFENTGIGIMIRNLDDRSLTTNNAICRMLGYSHDELEQMHFNDITHPEDRKAHRRTLDDLFAREADSYQRRLRFIRKNGQELWVLNNVSTISDEDGKILFITNLYQDMTVLRHAEEQLHQSQKMEVIGQLTGGVAHDFNNLLTVIQGNLELISDRISDPEIESMVTEGINASASGAELTHRLLAFSRKQTLKPTQVDIRELITSTSNILRRTLKETIDIDVKSTEDVWKCDVDSSQLEAAVLNLALNARDAMPHGGRLTVQSENVELVDMAHSELDDLNPGKYVKISVSDTGTGMPPDIIERVFEPFFTTKGVGEGSGLGLSMVHGFIKQSGGAVTISSSENVGTTVNLYLPKSTRSSAAPAKKILTAPLSNGERVLVVEDDPDVRKLTVRMLTNLGYNTVSATNGEQAITILKNTENIDILMSDVVLTGSMSGLDIAEKTTLQFPDIKILLVSGYAEDVINEHGPVMKNYQLLRKPYLRATLANKIRDVLQHPVH